MAHALQGKAPGNAVAQRLDDLFAILDRLVGDAVDGAAIDLVDHYVLGDVHQPPGQIAGIGGLQRRVGQPLARAVGGDEELGDVEPLLEAGTDRQFDDVAGRLGHEAAHPGELPNLAAAAARAGVGHHVHRVEALLVGFQRLHELVGQFVVGGAPHLDDPVVALFVGDVALQVLTVNLLYLGGSRLDHAILGIGHDDVVHADGGAEPGGVAESQLLYRVEHFHRDVRAVVLVAAGDQVAQRLLVERLVDVVHGGGQLLVEDHPARRRLQVAIVASAGTAVHAYVDQCVVVDAARVDRHHYLVGTGVVAALALRTRAHQRQVVDPEHHVLGRHHDRRAVGRVEQVLGGQHQGPRLDLRLRAQRDVHRHLVAVEVGVECMAHQRVQLDCLAFDQDRFERLDAEPMQGGRAVEQHRVLGDHFLEHRPHLGSLLLYQRLGLLDVEHHVLLHQLLHDERLEQLQRHLGGEPALVEFQIGAHDDDRPARVVDPLAEQVLAEAALLALEHVGQGLQRTVGGALDDALFLGVVEQRIDRFLQHPFLIADDDVRRVECQQALETIVAVDHPPVQIVEIGGGEAAAVKLYHGAQLRRDNRDNVQDQPLRLVARVAEVLDDLDPLQQALVALRSLLRHPRPQFDAERVEVHALQEGADRLRPDAGRERHPETVARFQVLLFGEQIHLLQIGIAGIDDDVLLVVQDGAQRGDRKIEQQPHARRHRAVEPDVRNRSGQFDMAHAFAPYPEMGHLDAAAVADHAPIANRLELPAVALPFLGGAEDALAEQAVLLRAQRAVIDGLRLLDLAVGPGANLLGRRELDGDAFEVLKIPHCCLR